MKPTSSRAIAVITLFFAFPRATHMGRLSRREAIRPRRLGQQPANVPIAGLGDGSLAPARTRRVLTGGQAEEAHQLAGGTPIRETPPVFRIRPTRPPSLGCLGHRSSGMLPIRIRRNGF